jgi:hypothetical protein
MLSLLGDFCLQKGDWLGYWCLSQTKLEQLLGVWYINKNVESGTRNPEEIRGEK